MTISFIFDKDWTGPNLASQGTEISFKKGEYVTGEVVDSGVQDPTNYVVITNTKGQARIPFGGKSYQGLNSILKSPVAPWLGETKVDTTLVGDYKAGDVTEKIKEISMPVKIIAGIVLVVILFFIIKYIKKLRSK